MSVHRTLNPGDALPASFIKALEEYVSTLTSNLRLTLASSTAVQVVASAGSGQVSVGISGMWRYRSASVTAAVPGGAGTKDVFVTATANSFGAADSDLTDYAFGLAVVASGGTPSGGGIAASRKIGEVDWDGAAITALRQEVESVHGQQLDDDVFAAGDLLATRQPGGGFLLSLADGSVTNAKVSSSAAIAESKLSLASDGAAGTPTRRTLGTGAQQAAAGNDARFTPPFVTVLPATPYDGQRVNFIADSSKGTVWELVYWAGAPTALKWHKVGGPQVVKTVAGASGTIVATGTAVASPSNPGPTVTAVLPGDYQFELLLNVFMQTASSTFAWLEAEAHLFMNGVSQGSMYNELGQGAATYVEEQHDGKKLIEVANVPAGAVFDVRYRRGGTAGASSVSFQNRALTMDAVRVNPA